MMVNRRWIHRSSCCYGAGHARILAPRSASCLPRPRGQAHLHRHRRRHAGAGDRCRQRRAQCGQRHHGSAAALPGGRPAGAAVPDAAGAAPVDQSQPAQSWACSSDSGSACSRPRRWRVCGRANGRSVATSTLRPSPPARCRPACSRCWAASRLLAGRSPRPKIATNARVAVLGHALWQRRFGGDAGHRRPDGADRSRAARGDRRDAGHVRHAVHADRVVDAVERGLGHAGHRIHLRPDVMRASARASRRPSSRPSWRRPCRR